MVESGWNWQPAPRKNWGREPTRGPKDNNEASMGGLGAKSRQEQSRTTTKRRREQKMEK